jgi:hypothetical protein
VIQQTQIKRLLERQLQPMEIETMLRVWKAEQRGRAFTAGRLGFAGGLERRGWLTRDPDGNLHLSATTRELLAEFCQSDAVGASRTAIALAGAVQDASSGLGPG